MITKTGASIFGFVIMDSLRNPLSFQHFTNIHTYSLLGWEKKKIKPQNIFVVFREYILSGNSEGLHLFELNSEFEVAYL